jgi:hypothetical protein
MRRGQFRSHLNERRCIIPAQGFYEWRDEGGKQPYYFSRAGGAPLMLADIWQDSEYKGDRRTAFAILTDEPNELVAGYHDRMPLVLADDKIGMWLDLSNADPLEDDLLLDLKAFAVRPMDRATGNVTTLIELKAGLAAQLELGCCAHCAAARIGCALGEIGAPWRSCATELLWLVPREHGEPQHLVPARRHRLKSAADALVHRPAAPASAFGSS